jgi:hypothetical protein
MKFLPVISAIILASVYIASGQTRFQGIRKRNQWISATAGATLAYIFVDLLPALAKRQAAFAEERHALALFPEERVYIAALIGFLTFYSLDHISYASRDGRNMAEDKGDTSALWLNITGFALYSGLVAYFLHKWVRRDVLALFFYTVAMAFHFLVISDSLQEEQGKAYSRTTRYVLASAVFIGYFLGLGSDLPEPVLDTLVGFVAGGVVINSVAKDMPKGTDTCFPAFIIGALIYALLLLLAD